MRILIATTLLMLLSPTASAADTYHERLSTRQHANSAPLATPVTYVAPTGKANRIVVYSAPWCAACQRLTPVIASLKKEGYKVEYRSVDENPDQLKFAYKAIPTIFFLSGESVIKKEIGYRSEEHIKRTLVLETQPAAVTTVSRWN